MNINDLEKLKLIMQNSPKPFDRSTVPFLPKQRTALEMQGFQDPFFNIFPGSSQEPLPQQNIIPDVSAFSQNVKNIKLAEEEAKRAEEMAKREGLARMLMALGDALKGEDVISNAMQRDQMFRKKENEKRREESISNFKELVKGTEFEEIANALGDEFAYNLYAEYTGKKLLAGEEPPKIVEGQDGFNYYVYSDGRPPQRVLPNIESVDEFSPSDIYINNTEQPIVFRGQTINPGEQVVVDLKGPNAVVTLPKGFDLVSGNTDTAGMRNLAEYKVLQDKLKNNEITQDQFDLWSEFLIPRSSGRMNREEFINKFSFQAMNRKDGLGDPIYKTYEDALQAAEEAWLMYQGVVNVENEQGYSEELLNLYLE